MNALPHASAGPAFHSGIIAGKLNGVMPATTPSGWRIEYTSMPVPAPSVYSPLSRCGMPIGELDDLDAALDVALGVGDGLAVLQESSSASSSTFWLTRSMNFIITRARRCGFHAAHSFCASTATATAASTSAREAIGTLACTSPVLGFITSAVRVDWPRCACR